jgi:hypothetical protein
VRFRNGKALVAIAFFEYRDTSIGAYREVGTVVAVVPKGLKPPKSPLLSLFQSADKTHMGFYIIDLPVTSALACTAGVEISGFPKFVTPIVFSLKGARFEGAVYNPETKGVLLKLSGSCGIGLSGPLLDFVLFTCRGGKIIRTLATTRGGARICLPGSIRLDVSDDQHPMAQRLIALGLNNAKPAFVSHSHTLQMRLPAGAVLP